MKLAQYLTCASSFLFGYKFEIRTVKDVFHALPNTITETAVQRHYFSSIGDRERWDLCNVAKSKASVDGMAPNSSVSQVTRFSVYYSDNVKKSQIALRCPTIPVVYLRLAEHRPKKIVIMMVENQFLKCRFHAETVESVKFLHRQSKNAFGSFHRKGGHLPSTSDVKRTKQNHSKAATKFTKEVSERSAFLSQTSLQNSPTVSILRTCFYSSAEMQTMSERIYFSGNDQWKICVAARSRIPRDVIILSSEPEETIYGLYEFNQSDGKMKQDFAFSCPSTPKMYIRLLSDKFVVVFEKIVTS